MNHDNLLSEFTADRKNINSHETYDPIFMPNSCHSEERKKKRKRERSGSKREISHMKLKNVKKRLLFNSIGWEFFRLADNHNFEILKIVI